jgi:hypothetical protein
VRRLERTDVRHLRDGVLAFELVADAFLYGMVRRIVGFLVEVGVGRRDPGESRRLVSGTVVCDAPWRRRTACTSSARSTEVSPDAHLHRQGQRATPRVVPRRR